MAVTSARAQPAPKSLPHTSLESVGIAFLKIIFAVFCVGYAVMAFDYFISFAAGQDSLWEKFFALTVSREYALGEGSARIEQHVAYSNALRFMLMHTTMGAVCMALGPFQFIAAVRRKYPALHRTLGKTYLVGVMLSMIAGLAYLTVTPFSEVFSGAPFAIGLIGLDLTVIYSAVKAYTAIRQRDVFRHQAWMALNYALLLPTPVLRLFWIIFGNTVPGMNQEEANLAITTFLVPISVLIGMVWIAAQRPRKTAV